MGPTAVLSIAALLAVAATSTTGDPSPGPRGEPILPLGKVQAGMRGYGKSVFRGTEIARFDVEVIDVVPKFLPKQDLIVVRCSGQDLEHSGILHGMSGSPIYLPDPDDGEFKVAGALAYGFSPFPKDPLAGITPIEAMLRERDRPLERIAGETGGGSSPTPPRAGGGLVGGARPLSIPLVAAGATRRAAAWIAEQFAPYDLPVYVGGGAGGRYDDTLRVEIEPGSALGVNLVRGDADLSGIGTTTWRDGETVLAFGHPMLQGGQWPFPVTTGWVHTVIADENYAYKLASPIAPVGTLLRDQQAAIVCRMGASPSMIPVSVRVRNARTGYEDAFAYEVLRHPLWTAMLVNFALFNSADAAEPVTGHATVKSRLRVSLAGRSEPIVLEDLSALTSGVVSPVSMLALPRLLLNPFGRVELARVEAELVVTLDRRAAEIEAAWADRGEVQAGEEVTLHVFLRPFDRERERVSVTFALPENLSAESYDIEVGAGKMTDPDAADPRTVEDLVRWVGAQYRSNDLVTVVELGTIGTKQEGRSLRGLPFSVFGTLFSSTSAGIAVAPDTLRFVTPTDYVLTGKKTVRIKVKNKGGGE